MPRAMSCASAPQPNLQFAPAVGGVVIAAQGGVRQVEHELAAWLEREGLGGRVGSCRVQSPSGEGVALHPSYVGLPGLGSPVQEPDTLSLRESLEFYGFEPKDGGSLARAQAQLRRETLLALLLARPTQHFPSVTELESALNMRVNIAQAARLSQLDFRTASAERPADCWVYDEDTGFTIRPGCSLIESLRKATQPELTGQVYSFSCYRATEYLVLLGIAQELERCNPALYERLEAQWRRRAISSDEFRAVFLREAGTLAEPVPTRCYVPGDRVWFRNPHEPSSDACGYEGSWTFYLGGGHFANLWKREQPFTLEGKCLEVFHWRDGLYIDQGGDPRVDEARVAEAVGRTEGDPLSRARVLARMSRLRDPYRVYAEGGCIDATREAPRWVQPSSCDVLLPAS